MPYKNKCNQRTNCSSCLSTYDVTGSVCYWCKDRCINPDVDAGYNPNICTSDKSCSEVPPSGSPSLVPTSPSQQCQQGPMGPMGPMGPIGPQGPPGPKGIDEYSGAWWSPYTY